MSVYLIPVLCKAQPGSLSLPLLDLQNISTFGFILGHKDTPPPANKSIIGAVVDAALYDSGRIKLELNKKTV